MSLLERFDGWQPMLRQLRAAWTTRWSRLPTAQRLLEIAAITIVVAAALLFVWVLWTEPAHRR